jgi:hypothetical protein
MIVQTVPPTKTTTAARIIGTDATLAFRFRRTRGRRFGE